VGALLAFVHLGVADAQEITVPAGFRIDVFADKLGGARGLAVAPDGVLLVSIAAQGRVVALPDRGGAGHATDVITVVKDLDLPHGLAVRRGHLYVAESGRIVRYRYRAATHTAAERMAKARAAKAAKKAERLALDKTPVLMGPGAILAPSLGNEQELRAILLELQTMFGYGSPRGRELCAKALRLLEARLGGTITPGVGCHKLNINKENT